jgi:hypothetical protein
MKDRHYEIGGPDPENPEFSKCYLSSLSMKDTLKAYFEMPEGEREGVFIDEWRVINGVPYPVREFCITTGNWRYSYRKALSDDILRLLKEHVNLEEDNDET